MFKYPYNFKIQAILRNPKNASMPKNCSASYNSIKQTITTLHDRKDGNGHYVKSNLPAFTLSPEGDIGIIPRQCTWDFKVVPLDQAARKIGGIKRGQKTVGVIQWIGISLDEVVRMKPGRHPWSEHRWPLIEKRITRHDCKRWMESHGYPEPPRSACLYCPYHSDHEWRRLRDDEPESFAEAVRVDKEIRRLKQKAGFKNLPFVHRLCVPLDEVDFRTDEDHGQQTLFGNECEGMCGV